MNFEANLLDPKSDMYKELNSPCSDFLSNLGRDSLIYSTFFFVLFLFTKFVFEKLLPKYYASLGEAKRNEIGPYLASLVHHSFVVYLGIAGIIAEAYRPENVSYSTYMDRFGVVVPFCFGFLLAETIFLCM